MKALQRQKEKEKVSELPGVAPPSGVQVVRSVDTLLETWRDVGLGGLRLTQQELVLLIDNGSTLDEQRKAITKEVERIVAPTKMLLLALAEQQKWKVKAGKIGECKIGAGSSTKIKGTVTEFAILLKNEGKLELFNDLVSIKIGETKKYLGEDALKNFMEVESKEYSSVSLSLKKK